MGNVLKTKFSDLDVDKDGHITESDLQKFMKYQISSKVRAMEDSKRAQLTEDVKRQIAKSTEELKAILELKTLPDEMSKAVEALQTATEATIEGLTKECGAGEEKRLTEEAGRRVWAIVQMADTDSNDKLSFEEFKQFLGNKDLDYFDNALDLDKDFNPAQLASKNKKKNGRLRPKSIL